MSSGKKKSKTSHHMVRGVVQFAGLNLQTNRDRIFLVDPQTLELLTVDDLIDIHPELEAGDEIIVAVQVVKKRRQKQ